MLLESDGYQFPVITVENDFEPNIIDIYIGNPKCRPKPCVSITIFNQKEAVLNDITFFPTCSITRKSFKRRSNAMKILIMISMKWIIQTYPKVKYVNFTDKSFFEENTKTILLPEKMVLTEGKTWYEKHLSAVPSNLTTKRSLNRYRRAHQLYAQEFQALPMEAWYSENIKGTLSKYATILEPFQLSETSWKVSKETILSYPVISPILIQEGGKRKENTQYLWMKPTWKDYIHIWR